MVDACTVDIIGNEIQKSVRLFTWVHQLNKTIFVKCKYQVMHCQISKNCRSFNLKM